tara:strand:+ start:621 stop:725 length:105 start_codon:yes stop_codon:yes gene_type:complete
LIEKGSAEIDLSHDNLELMADDNGESNPTMTGLK